MQMNFSIANFNICVLRHFIVSSYWDFHLLIPKSLLYSRLLVIKIACCKKTIKENLGDTNKRYLTLHEVDSLLLEN